MLLRMLFLATATTAVLSQPAHAQEDTVPEWEGSFGVEDISTRFKLSGFAEMSITPGLTPVRKLS
jgi:hypothetical protein